MRKTVLIFVIAFALLMATSMANAGYWSRHCENYSCVATHGAIKIYWTATSVIPPGGAPKEASMAAMFTSGRITGVEGLPLSIEDFQSIEKNVNAILEKNITIKENANANVNLTTPGSEGAGAGAGAGSNEENIFSKKRTIGQGSSMGERVNVNYILAFVTWLGDTKYGELYKEGDIQRYMAAAEDIMDAYYQGGVKDLVESFFISQRANDLDRVSLSEELTEDNKKIMLIKYIALTKFFDVDNASQRYRKAAVFLNAILSSTTDADIVEMREEIMENFKEDITNLKKITTPGMTALQLYKNGDKLTAFAKWEAETQVDKFLPSIRKMPLEDRYIISLNSARRIKNNQFKNEQEASIVRAELEAFEKEIQNSGEQVKIVTVKAKPKTTKSYYFLTIPLAVGVGLAVFYIRRKKKKKNSQ